MWGPGLVWVPPDRFEAQPWGRYPDYRFDLAMTRDAGAMLWVAQVPSGCCRVESAPGVLIAQWKQEDLARRARSGAEVLLNTQRSIVSHL